MLPFATALAVLVVPVELLALAALLLLLPLLPFSLLLFLASFYIHSIEMLIFSCVCV